MDFNAIYQGLVDHPSSMLLALALLVIGYLYRARVDDMHAQMDAIKEQANKHLDTVERIVPLTEKLNASIEILERLTSRAAGRE